MKHKIVLFLLLATIQSATPDPLTPLKIYGKIYEDKNNNGIQDKGEKGINNIAVSNGEEIVTTNKQGEYTLRAAPGDNIFPILPACYTLKGDKIANHRFTYIPMQHTTANDTISFAVHKQHVKETFTLGAIGDIQMKNREELEYGNQTIIAELAKRKDLDFNLFLGDLVNNNTALLPTVTAMLRTLPTDSYTLVGNHDRDIEEECKKQVVSFQNQVGAPDYAFNYGNVHFIVLNNIFGKGNREYEGRFTETQLRFVAADIALLPLTQRIVLAMHIPLCYTHNREEMTTLFKGRKELLVLSGHTHQIERDIYTTPNGLIVNELTAGAACGNWWIGERDFQRLPNAHMQCGSPRNYFTLTFTPQTYQIKFKGIGLDPDKQMDIWVAKTDTLDNNIALPAMQEKNRVIANVYGGSDSTTVTLQIDNGKTITMSHEKWIAPSVARIIEWNNDGTYPSKHSRRGALRKRPSPHIWSTLLPADLPQGVHQIRIVAKDPYGFEASDLRTFIKQAE